jgi:hypothetical protein
MSVEVLGSKLEGGRFPCDEFSEVFLVVGGLGDAISSPYPIYRHNQ